ncbi:hypothetical protein EMIHUDRAFT_373151 [Emiliania huxleyi CCMP1516]|nr:hypothetical protein EMIHUDRAFT_373151 [Emiliania huxleyi CCMP1516]EOD37571.1 hypothetical protein EMIHUDRAFT_373151 [Emiliania huxleyi CCMP1516]|eukprot:XP_005790000.1 hypothetical protein EMIHUDRAFT_373151 [Emiliania huxleyi CCMP1516]
MRRLDSDFHVDYTVRPWPGLTISGVQFEYGGSGCGSDNSKCGCTTNAEGRLVMTGRGTDGTATGLDFKCNFNVGATQCHVHVDIPYVGDNSVDCSCNDGKHTFTGCDISSSGHDWHGNMDLNPP